MDVVSKARHFAYLAHKGMKDDEGLDYYIAHLCNVAGLLLDVGADDNLVAAAYLHDTVEDTDTTEEMLRNEFPDDVVDLVMEVTHEGRQDSYGHWFPRLKSQRGIMLKFADRLSNLSRMESWSEKRKAQYLRKSRYWKSEGPK